jgi:hypothetical protein
LIELPSSLRPPTRLALGSKPSAEQTSDKTREAGDGAQACAKAGANTPTSIATSTTQAPRRSLNRRLIMEAV